MLFIPDIYMFICNEMHFIVHVISALLNNLTLVLMYTILQHKKNDFQNVKV